MIVPVLLFLLGFACLIKGGDWFVDGAVGIAHRFHLPELLIGANLFNIILVSGIAITINPFNVPAEKTIAGMNSSLVIDVPVMLAVLGIMCIPALIKEKLYRWQGILLLCIYVAFTAYQFVS